MGARVYLVDVKQAELARNRQLAADDKARRRKWKRDQIKLIEAGKQASKQAKAKRKGKPKPPPAYRVYKHAIIPYRPGMGSQFYDTAEWMNVRYKALKAYGLKCHCCGAQGQEIEFHVDHIKPRSKYPDLELKQDNLQILCRACNLGKGNTDSIDWRTSGPITQAA